MDQYPIQGESKTLIRLTLQKTAISTSSMGHLTCKGFSIKTQQILSLEELNLKMNKSLNWPAFMAAVVLVPNDFKKAGFSLDRKICDSNCAKVHFSVRHGAQCCS